MKRVDQNRKSKSRKTAVNTVLIVAAAILLIAGVILLLIEPIKRHNRKKISEDALTVISEGRKCRRLSCTLRCCNERVT